MAWAFSVRVRNGSAHHRLEADLAALIGFHGRAVNTRVATANSRLSRATGRPAAFPYSGVPQIVYKINRPQTDL